MPSLPETEAARPYPTEHACRLREPGSLTKPVVRVPRKSASHGGKVYEVIRMTDKKTGKFVDQAFRYKKATWSANEAGSHCRVHGGRFEVASTAKEGQGMAMNPGLFYRAETLRKEDYVEDAHRVSLTFSSEAAVQRWYGKEVLLHDRDAVDLTRLKDMGAVLVNHMPSVIAGPIIKAELGDDYRGHAVVAFDQDPEGQRAEGKVKTGSLRGVSVGYIIHKAKRLVDEKEEFEHPRLGKVYGPALIATRWEPVEISLTPVPADSHVGVGRDAARSLDGIEIERSTPTREDDGMDEKIRTELVALGLDPGADEEMTLTFLQDLRKPEPVFAELKTDPGEVDKLRADAEKTAREECTRVLGRAAAVGLTDYAAGLMSDGKSASEVQDALWQKLADGRGKALGETHTEPKRGDKLDALTDEELMQAVTAPEMDLDD